MRSQALQEMVKKVFGDETLKARFLACPESVMSGFALTAEEAQAVLNTHRLVQTGNSTLEAAITAKESWSAPALETSIIAKESWSSPTS